MSNTSFNRREVKIQQKAQQLKEFLIYYLLNDLNCRFYCPNLLYRISWGSRNSSKSNPIDCQLLWHLRLDAAQSHYNPLQFDDCDDNYYNISDFDTAYLSGG